MRVKNCRAKHKWIRSAHYIVPSQVLYYSRVVDVSICRGHNLRGERNEKFDAHEIRGIEKIVCHHVRSNLKTKSEINFLFFSFSLHITN